MVVVSAIYYCATVLSRCRGSACVANTLVIQLYTAKGVNKLILIDPNFYLCIPFLCFSCFLCHSWCHYPVLFIAAIVAPQFSFPSRAHMPISFLFAPSVAHSSHQQLHTFPSSTRPYRLTLKPPQFYSPFLSTTTTGSPGF